MKIQIKSVLGALLFEGDFASFAEAVSAAIKAKANLSYASLGSADLSYANLSYANLRSADLSYANLRSADLSSANLGSADLRSASLSYADLSFANLSYANLGSADLRSANLSYANLRSANLSYANLSYANLSSAKNSALVIAMTRILPAGELVGWKKLSGDVIAELLIPRDAKRSHAFGRKCRAEFATVVRLIGAKGKEVTEAFSLRDSSFRYAPGITVRPTEPFSDDWADACASGIHFFITREEAEAYAP